jgi:hypothetical protein
MAEPDAKQVEAVARALCASRDMDPDEITYHYNGDVEEPFGPAWVWYEPAARAVLALPWLAAALRLAEAYAAQQDAHRVFDESHYRGEIKEAASKMRGQGVALLDAQDAYREARRDLEDRA